MQRLLSIDIGSTYSKGAIFVKDGKFLRVEAKCTVPTTTEHLPDGFFKILESLELASDDLKNIPTAWSSSAKGGLGIIAIGIVPELTLKMAREAACSAGGKILSVYNYKLNTDDLHSINTAYPDILLLTGGTDGGNETILLHNAEILTGLNLDIPIIYAGNRAARPQIRKLFAQHKLHIVDNVLPNLETPNPLPARNKIREIFLEQIVLGKSLRKISELTGRDPRPTPYSMLEFIRTAHNTEKIKDFCVIDMGGATTDFYSSSKAPVNGGVIIKGLKEPDVKRTVEGDIGMRISALATAEVNKDFIHLQLERHGLQVNSFEQYTLKVTEEPEHLPQTEAEEIFDKILATACVITAAGRHAGRRHKVYTVSGPVEVQTGKSLRQVKTIIGTGGYLAGCAPDFMRSAFSEILPQKEDEIYLLPEKPEFVFDSDYLFPLLANSAEIYPAEAVNSLCKIFLMGD
jgi:uncharacterized protein (TIGR01319 family)